ncbi:hypothetical protein ACJIZ3_009945 [Penstemon smallii]|uniref:RING-type domain-containing protein n=1 Tax=Penstemon smallii TaxID=265156 RepID=A0ABD3TDX8_9LAMI
MILKIIFCVNYIVITCVVLSRLCLNLRKMLGGGGGVNGNTIFPGFVEENRVQYDNNTLPQLQLFGHDPIQCGVGIGTTNYVENNNERSIKRPREGEPVYNTHQKLHMSLNSNLCHDETGNVRTFLSPNPVSTGLRLSSDEDERNSSVSSACENVRNALPASLSLGNTLKMEIDQQTEEFGRYIKLQEENILKGVRELSQRHTVSLLNALEKGVSKKLYEKEVELATMNQKNKELGDRIKQVTTEAQSWHYRAKYNESVVNVLKNNIQQLMAQGTGQAREGTGESEVDDAISCTNLHQGIIVNGSTSGNQVQNHQQPKCRSCKSKEVSVLLLPCRHLCLCTDCEGFIDICPICQVMKTAGVHVYM